MEHLIPFSKSLDDSVSNKVVCFRQANRDKGNKTPYEAFSSSPGDYVWENIYSRAKDLSGSKQWRFDKNALEKWQKNSEGEFTQRHLNDTRYIGRLAKEFLENICEFNKIDVVTGRLTAILRHYWGLNSVLAELKGGTNQENIKQRDDHRHHAIDAIVIGMTNRSTLQKISYEANRTESELSVELNRLLGGRIDPWDGFRKDVMRVVEDIVVSHKVSNKTLPSESVAQGRTDVNVTDGALHNDTAVGIVSEPDKKGRCEVVVRWPIDKFESKSHIESIRDEHLRKQFLKVYQENQKQGVINFAKLKKIRSLRRTEQLKVIPVQDSAGITYKAYKGDANWGVEVFEYPKGHAKAGQWVGVVISRFDANQINFQPGQTCRPHPAAKLIMRLQINDCIEVHDSGTKHIMRLQKITHAGNLSFAIHSEANVDARDRNKDDQFSYWNKRASLLKSFRSKKLHVSPSGCVSYTK